MVTMINNRHIPFTRYVHAARTYLKIKTQPQNDSSRFKPEDYKVISDYRSQFDLLEKGCLFSVSDLKGTILYANENFCDTSKYKLDELVGQSHSIVRHPETPPEVFRCMWKTIGAGKVWQGELKNQAKDGSHYWVSATVIPVLGKNGKPEKYLCMRQDITKEKQLEEKLHLINEINNHTLFDSVSYAKQVHGTFLTPEKVLKETFQQSFLIYKAQNIVSGDFHMIQKIGNTTSIILGDSTGHGVSASYISIMILNILNRMMRTETYGISDTFQELHREITLIRNSNSSASFIESADMAYAKIDHETLTMEYSIAKLKGILIRDEVILELNREKCSIGDPAAQAIRLSKNIVNLKRGDLIYFYTDGFVDQFGGQFNKKFTNKRLMETISSCSRLSMNEQKLFISKVLKDWQGECEQTDDMSLIGVRV